MFGNIFIFMFFVFILLCFFVKQKLKIYLCLPIFKLFKNKIMFVFTFFSTILKKGGSGGGGGGGWKNFINKTKIIFSCFHYFQK